MKLDALEARLKEIMAAVEQSISNHNALIGRREELIYIIEEAKKAASVVETVATEAEKALEPSEN